MRRLEGTLVTGNCELARCALPSQVRGGLDRFNLAIYKYRGSFFSPNNCYLCFFELPRTQRWQDGEKKPKTFYKWHFFPCRRAQTVPLSEFCVLILLLKSKVVFLLLSLKVLLLGVFMVPLDRRWWGWGADISLRANEGNCCFELLRQQFLHLIIYTWIISFNFLSNCDGCVFSFF